MVFHSCIHRYSTTYIIFFLFCNSKVSRFYKFVFIARAVSRKILHFRIKAWKFQESFVRYVVSKKKIDPNCQPTWGGCSPPERGVQPPRNLKLTKHGRVGYQWKEHLKTFPKIYNMPIFESFTEGGAEKTLHYFRIFEKIRTKIFNLQFFLINYCKL